MIMIILLNLAGPEPAYLARRRLDPLCLLPFRVPFLGLAGLPKISLRPCTSEPARVPSFSGRLPSALPLLSESPSSSPTSPGPSNL